MKRRGAAVLLALLAAGPALLSTGRAAPPDPVRARAETEVRLRRAEAALLHRRVDLGGLRLWHNGAFRQQAPAGDVVVLHLWATTCRPCREEMPVLRRVVAELWGEPGLEVALVSEDDEETLSRLLADPRRAPDLPLPAGRHYLNSSLRLRAALQNDMQPLTLLLDRGRVVRQALAGSLAGRRNELVRGIEGLLYGSRHGRERGPGRDREREPDRNSASIGRRQPGPAPASWEAQWGYGKIEAALLHHVLDGRLLRPWQARRQRWGDGALGGGPPTALFLVPDPCPGCPAEFRRFSRIAQGFSESKVRFVSAAPPPRRKGAPGSEGAEAPPVWLLPGQPAGHADAACYQLRGPPRLYSHDLVGRRHPVGLADVIAAWHGQAAVPAIAAPPRERALPEAATQPLVLLLDGHLTVRQAVLGPLGPRLGELVAGIERLGEVARRPGRDPPRVAQGPGAGR